MADEVEKTEKIDPWDDWPFDDDHEAPFTPRLLDGTRLQLPASVMPGRDSKALGYIGRVCDPATGQYYDVFGATCPAHGCCCDAVAVPVADENAPLAPEPTHETRKTHDEHEAAEILDKLAQIAAHHNNGAIERALREFVPDVIAKDGLDYGWIGGNVLYLCRALADQISGGDVTVPLDRECWTEPAFQRLLAALEGAIAVLEVFRREDDDFYWRCQNIVRSGRSCNTRGDGD